MSSFTVQQPWIILCLNTFYRSTWSKAPLQPAKHHPHQLYYRGKLMQAKQTAHFSTHLFFPLSLSAHTYNLFLNHFSFHKQHNKLLLSSYEEKTIVLGILPGPSSIHAIEAFEHLCIPSTTCFNKNSPFASAKLL